MATIDRGRPASTVETLRCDAYNDDPLRVARVAMKLPPRGALEEGAKRMAALGHPLRATIFAAIGIEPLCVCELSALLDMSSPALMHHLKVLGRAGLIEVRKEGKFAVYHPVDLRAEAVLDAVLRPEPEVVGGKR